MNPVWYFLNGVPTLGGPVTVAGAITATGAVTGTNLIAGAGNVVAFTGRSSMSSPADGQFTLSNNAITAGVGLNVGTDAAVSVRTRAQSAFATLHAFLRDVCTESAETTDGNVTYTTTQVLGGIITRSNMSSNRVDAFPTAANLVAAIPGCAVGTSFDVLINNNDTAQTLTVNGASTGITYEGAATALAATEARLFRVLITNITGASEAATVFQVV